MALSDFVIQTARIELPGGGSFDVRGLSLNDVIGLVLEQKAAMEQVFNFIEQHQLHEGSLNADVGLQLLRQMPEFGCKLIAVAAGEPDQVAKVAGIPAPKQLEALEQIAKLTFTDAAGFKAFVGKVVAAVQGAQAVLPSEKTLELPSSDGSIE
jgi:hypothetical protein